MNCNQEHASPAIRGALFLAFSILLAGWHGVAAASESKEGVAFGTGFVVSTAGHVLTAWHVLKDKRQVLVGPVSGNKMLKAKVLKVDPENDLALLEVSRKLGPPLAIAEWSSVPVGLEVYAVGYPRPKLLGLSKKITQGILNGERGEKGKEGHFQFSAEIQKGNSGGPLLAPDGSVVGVVLRKLDALKVAERSRDLPQNVSYALNSAVVMRFLRDAGLDQPGQRVNLSVNTRPFELFRQAEASIVLIVARNKASDGAQESAGEPLQ